MKHPQVASRFVLRTPLLPFHDWLGCSDETVDRRAARARLEALLSRPEVDEALFVASPSLHSRLAQWRADPDSIQGRKVEQALVRYVSRMVGRATPFGLFAGVSVGRVGKHTSLALEARAGYRRYTRIDNDYLFALAEAVGTDPEIRPRLRYRPNSSLYLAAGRLRYAEARLNGKERRYHLVSVEPNEYLQATLDRAQDGAALADLAAALAVDDPEIDLTEAEAYVNDLVEAQILQPTIGVTITGSEPVNALVDALQEADVVSVSQPLAQVREQLATMDRRGLGAEPVCYREAAAALEAASSQVPADITRLFQVDLVKPAPRAELGRAFIAEIQRGVDILRRTSPRRDDSLGAFRRTFRERYEDRELPLVEVLDEGSGIGFESTDAPGSEGSPLLAELDFPSQSGPQTIDWHERDAYLLTRVHEVIARGADELVLTDADLRRLEIIESARLPAAFAVMARLAASSPQALQRGDGRVLIEGLIGPSGARLLGRFCHATSEMHELVGEHLRAEEALAPDAMFAEVVHLNEGRTGNIICRPVLRDYEIPFLGLSGAAPERQLPISDLLVSVRGERIVLRSHRLGCQVIPRLTTAHNFRLRSLGLYRFLAALQSQDGDALAWRWGILDSAPRLPRIRYGRVLLARARWRLYQTDLAPLVKAVRTESSATTAAERDQRRRETLGALQRLRAARDLPRFVVLAEGDNEWPVDFDNSLSAETFAHALASRGRSANASVDLYEQFPAPNELVVHGPEGAFTHEIILPFVQPPEPRSATVPVTPPEHGAERRFAPGSTWLYAKVYTGQSTADRVLGEALAPVVRAALAEEDAESWFFLRYADPEPHLRVRFRGNPSRLYGRLLPALHRALAPLIDQGAVWRVQLDTYEREIERYGGAHGIDLAEALFRIDSDAVLAIVERLEGDSGKDARWRLALRGADLLLEDLGLDTAARERVFARAGDSFGREFHANAALRKQIGGIFRKERTELEVLLSRDPEHISAHPLVPGFDLLARRSKRLRPLGEALHARAHQGLLTTPLEDMVWSFVHMHINRLLHASQRAQELVIYDLLKRAYTARREYAAASEYA